MQNQALDPSLERFLAKTKPNTVKNKLDEFEEQIFFLKSKGYSDRQVVDFLKIEKGLATTQQSVNRFINKRMDKSKIQKTVSRRKNRLPERVSDSQNKQGISASATSTSGVESQSESNSDNPEKKSFNIIKMSDEQAKKWLNS